MLSDANLLILDEPTNHLDMVSKEILEDAINSYEGTVLYVSHDRYFINKTATRILDLTEHTLLNYTGNYEYYLEKKELTERLYLEATKTKESTSPDASPAVTETKADWQQQKEEQARLRKRQNDLKRTEEEIERLEHEKEAVDAALSDPENMTDHAKLTELTGKRQELEEALEHLMEQWEELAE